MDAVLHAYNMRARGDENRFRDTTWSTERTLTQTCQLQKLPEDNVRNTQHPLWHATSKRNLTILSNDKKYTNTPLNIAEHRWNISGIATPVTRKQPETQIYTCE